MEDSVTITNNPSSAIGHMITNASTYVGSKESNKESNKESVKEWKEGREGNEGKENKQEWLLYPQSNYEFNIDDKLKQKFIIDIDKHRKRIISYNKDGIRNTVLAILLCHRYEYPHLLLLQHQGSENYYLLGGKYKKWEKPKDVLKKKLQRYINKIKETPYYGSGTNPINLENDEAVEIGDFLGEWWRTQFNSSHLPYLPAHTTRPKEYVRLYQVTLAPKCIFHLPPGFTLKAVPLFDLCNCGQAISGVSSILSRFKLHCMVHGNSKITES